MLCHQLAFASLPAQGWKGLAQPLAFHPAPSHLQQHGRHWRLELAARKLSLARLHQAGFLPLHPTSTSQLSMFGGSQAPQAPSPFQKV